MMKSRLLVTLTITAVVAGCAAFDHHNHSGAAMSANIQVHRDATTNNESIEVNARNSGAAVPLQWSTDDPASTLDILFKDSNQQCVVDLKCGTGGCTANTNAGYKGATPLHCAYTTSLNGGAVKHDPVIIIVSCCP